MGQSSSSQQAMRPAPSPPPPTYESLHTDYAAPTQQTQIAVPPSAPPQISTSNQINQLNQTNQQSTTPPKDSLQSKLGVSLPDPNASNRECREWLQIVLRHCGYSPRKARSHAKRAMPEGTFGINLLARMNEPFWKNLLGDRPGRSFYRLLERLKEEEREGRAKISA